MTTRRADQAGDRQLQRATVDSVGSLEPGGALDVEISSTFAGLLRAHRLAAGLTQEELAVRAGLSGREVSDLERGLHARPYQHTIRLIAAALGLSDAERERLIRSRSSNSRAPATNLDEDFTDGQSAAAAALLSPTHLPHLPNSTIGREREIAELVRLVQQPEPVLLTIVGPPGVGKTRLAIEVARRADRILPNRSVFVDLAPLTDAEQVPVAIARSVKILETQSETPTNSLEWFLHQGPILLVLDNFEHVMGATPVIEEALETAPELKILITSRVPLYVPGEQLFETDPLTLPVSDLLATPASVANTPAVALFVARLHTFNPRFTLTSDNAPVVAQICRRLDGLPLALELVAAWGRAVSPRDMLEQLDTSLDQWTNRLHSFPPRHRSLQAAIDWSYTLLSTAERTAFRRLSVFAGGFSLSGAEAVVATSDDAPSARGDDAEIRASDVLDLLLRLIDRSMVISDEDSEGRSRFRLLESLKQFGRMKLDELGTSETCRARHALFYFEVASQLGHSYSGRKVAVKKFLVEHDNLRGALSWLIEQRDATRAHQMVQALAPYWTWLRLLTEAADSLERVLPLAGVPPAMRAETLIHAVRFTSLVARREAAEASWVELSRMGQDLDSPSQKARAQLVCVLARLPELGEDEVVRELGDVERLARESGDATAIGGALANLGTQLVRFGRTVEARQTLAEAIEITERTGEWLDLVFPLAGLTNALALSGEDLGAARAHAERALAILHEMTEERGSAEAYEALGMVALLEQNYPEAGRFLRRSLVLRRNAGDWPLVSHSLERLAALASLTGHPERALLLEAASAKLRPTARLTAAVAWRPRLQTWLDEARRALGGADGPLARRARAAGELMTLQEAIAEALSDLGESCQLPSPATMTPQ